MERAALIRPTTSAATMQVRIITSVEFAAFPMMAATTATQHTEPLMDMSITPAEKAKMPPMEISAVRIT